MPSSRKTQHGKPHAKNLAGAEVAVRFGSEVEIFSKRLHGNCRALLYAFSAADQGCGWRVSMKAKNGHEKRESDKHTVADDGHAGERFGRGEAAAVDVHMQQIGARNNAQESDQDQSDERSPDAKLPPDQQEQPEQDLGEGQRVCDKGNAHGREQFYTIPPARRNSRGWWKAKNAAQRAARG